MFSVSYFCTRGNPLKKNQDRVYVNGLVLAEGILHAFGYTALRCFVADGVGSMANSEHAAQYVLHQIGTVDNVINSKERDFIRDHLLKTNHNLVELNRNDEKFRSSATTLCGLILDKHGLLTMNVGDSEILVFKQDMLTRVTIPQVFDDLASNSPLISYLGSTRENMTLDFDSYYNRYDKGDIVIVTTDGLLKAISRQQLRAILNWPVSLQQKVVKVYSIIQEHSAPDNLGAIFITQDEAR